MRVRAMATAMMLALLCCRNGGAPVAPMLDRSPGPPVVVLAPREHDAGAAEPPPDTTTYEEAIAHLQDDVPSTGPDLTNAQLGSPLRDARFIATCGAPETMKVTVRIAVREGRAVGVSVYTNPVELAVASCVDRYVRRLAWPSSPKLDAMTTTY